MSTAIEPRSRLARLTILSVAFAAAAMLAGVLLVIEMVIAPTVVDLASLPFLYGRDVPGRSVLLAAVFAAAAVVMTLSAAHVRVLYQVLRRDRRLPGLHRGRVSAMMLRRTAVDAGIDGPDGHQDARQEALSEALPVALPTLEELESVGPAVRITVLVPAHDERLVIGLALTSLREQTRPPDHVVVIADNCTDETADIARSMGATVIETVDNTEKKAGALNQVLAGLLPGAEVPDVFMVMDADTALVPDFLEIAAGRLEQDADLIAVGGIFEGEPGGGLVGQLQRNEYARYRRQIGRRKGRVFVLTGTATLFRAYALRAVADARGLILPGPTGKVYDTWAMTEDNELTLALKTLGGRMVSPQECRCITEIMPDWRALWRQRSRWQRGALENVGAYGLTRTTAIYWWQQLGIGYGTLAFQAFLLLMLVTLISAPAVALSGFWVGIGSVFLVERIVTVWGAGWRGRLLALPLVVELVYDVFLQAVYVASLWSIATGRTSGWNTVAREETP
ncbi:glycosyltransferase family 2 protein [Nocardioides sp. URHA0020]|uniref:glycosyltransferase family 2 protein n=1 Tax=Nocardioides sp. URHA0020 TaxID=1380392 RepID=UPI000A492F05|nr:glycosyltransferase family 2 protein [Nocardioides sp. URHA0020]